MVDKNEGHDQGFCIERLAEMAPGTIIDVTTLAEIFGRHPTSIKRAVQRGELPAPTKMLGKSCWTAGRIIEYIEDRLQKAQDEANKEKARLARIGA